MQSSVGDILTRHEIHGGFRAICLQKLGPQNVDWQGISLPCTSASGFSLKCRLSLKIFEVNQNKPCDRA